MPGMPLITVGMVVGHDPDGGGVMIALKSSGQIPGDPIKVLYNGPADALRIHQQPLPARNTFGIICFPYGDMRNGVWLGAFYPSNLDAITSTGSGQGTSSAVDAFIDYMAHFSGFWQLLDGSGNQATQWPDGSFLTMSAASGLPQTYRHTVENNERVKIPYLLSDRIAAPVDPFTLQFKHISGTAVTINDAGTLSVSGVSGSEVIVNADGDMIINIKDGRTFKVNCNGADLEIDAGGNININADNGGEVNISEGGASATNALAKAAAVVSAYNGHVHTIPTGLTGPANPTMSDVSSSVAFVSD